jgi:DNA-directed RNA polymerase I, II, and III subunit RPABC5
MLIPVRCSNCGKLLADKYDYYMKQLRLLKGSAALEPICFDGKKVIKTVEADVLDKMQINRYCCRKNFLTHVPLIDKV